MRGCVERRVQRNKVRARKQGVERNEFRAHFARSGPTQVRIVNDHAHPKRRDFSGQERADPPAADQAASLAAQSLQRRHFGDGPAVFPCQGNRGNHLPAEHEQQRERVVGNFIQAVVRNVRHHDAAFGGRRNVDRVHADAVAHDDAAALHRVDRAPGDRRPRIQHAVGVPAQFCNLLFVHGLPCDQRAPCGFHRTALLLDVRKSVIRDNDFQILLRAVFRSALSSTDFSLWVFVRGSRAYHVCQDHVEPHRLKSVLLKAHKFDTLRRIMLMQVCNYFRGGTRFV